MIWCGILSIQDDCPPACLGAGRDPSAHHVPCKHASASVNGEQMVHDLVFIRHESGSEGKDWRVFGHKSLLENRLKEVFVYSRILVSSVRTAISSGTFMLTFSN